MVACSSLRRASGRKEEEGREPFFLSSSSFYSFQTDFSPPLFPFAKRPETPVAPSPFPSANNPPTSPQTMTTASEFDRASPLFEKESVPFDIHTRASNSKSSNSRSQGTYTVRILRGSRSTNNGNNREQVIRFEMSDECSLITAAPSSTFHPSTPSNRKTNNFKQQTPIIHAPFLTADRGQGQSSCFANSSFTLQSQRTEMTISNRPIQLYELEVGESDFAELRRDQALLVDFNDFANSMITLLQCCELGDGDNSNTMTSDDQTNNSYNPHQQNNSSQCQMDGGLSGGWSSQMHCQSSNQLGNNSSTMRGTPSQHSSHQQRHSIQQNSFRSPSPYGNGMPVSTYSCRLETDLSQTANDGVQWRTTQNSSSASKHARFSIVESNQFRELTHLSLSLNVGTDNSVRVYLSSRLIQSLLHNRAINTLVCEQKQRSEVAETTLISLNKRLQEMAQTAEADKAQLRCQAEERIQTEHNNRLAEVSDIKSSKDTEVMALNEQLQRSQVHYESKIRVLEDINKNIIAEKSACDNENESLSTRLNIQETTNKSLKNEISSLRSQLQQVSSEKSNIEKCLHELQIQLASLEHSNIRQDKAISQTEAQRLSAERVSADAKQTLVRQQSQMEDLRRRLSEAESEAARYKELTSRYQTNRIEMKKRIKEKIQTIREQEEVLVTRENEVGGWKQRVNALEDALRQTRKEKADALLELTHANTKMEEDATKLENNQQVSN